MKFCKDCKHGVGEGERMTCSSPNNSVPSTDEAKYLVTGIEQPVIIAIRGYNCIALRMKRPQEIEELVCGVDGKWFEKKENK